VPPPRVPLPTVGGKISEVGDIEPVPRPPDQPWHEGRRDRRQMMPRAPPVVLPPFLSPTVWTMLTTTVMQCTHAGTLRRWRRSTRPWPATTPPQSRAACARRAPIRAPAPSRYPGFTSAPQRPRTSPTCRSDRGPSSARTSACGSRGKIDGHNYLITFFNNSITSAQSSKVIASQTHNENGALPTPPPPPPPAPQQSPVAPLTRACFRSAATACRLAAAVASQYFLTRTDAT
jgi:hypothetical protein